jgi:hypothetical protein
MELNFKFYNTTISMCVVDDIYKIKLYRTQIKITSIRRSEIYNNLCELIVCAKSCLSSGCVHVGRSHSAVTVMQLPTYSSFLFVACDLNNCYEMTLIMKRIFYILSLITFDTKMSNAASFLTVLKGTVL